MGYRAGLHVLSPEQSSVDPPFPVLLAVAGVFAGIVIAGVLARTAIEVAKGAGDAFSRAWTGDRS